MTLALRQSEIAELPRGKRCFSRARLQLPARLVTFDGTTDCTLIDLSRTGARLSSGTSPRVGAMVLVQGLEIELFGTVRWSRAKLFGLEFDAPLPHERVVALRYYADDEGARQEEAQLAYARSWVQGVV